MNKDIVYKIKHSNGDVAAVRSFYVRALAHTQEKRLANILGYSNNEPLLYCEGNLIYEETSSGIFNSTQHGIINLKINEQNSSKIKERTIWTVTRHGGLDPKYLNRLDLSEIIQNTIKFNESAFIYRHDQIHSKGKDTHYNSNYKLIIKTEGDFASFIETRKIFSDDAFFFENSEIFKQYIIGGFVGHL